MKFYSRLCGGEIGDHLGRLKNPSALPSAALHHPPWDYGIVFALRRDTAVAPGGGRSFYSCTTLAAGLLKEETTVMFILGWTPRGCATAPATALFGPWPYSPFVRRSLRPSSRHRRSGLRLGWGRSPTSSTTSGGHLCHQVVTLGVA
jgi:hypothetical protein